MKKLLWLDDQRNPFLDKYAIECLSVFADYRIIWVRNGDEFKEYLRRFGLPDVISFDHDLADEHYTPEFFWDDYDLSLRYQLFNKHKYKQITGEGCARYLRSYCNLKGLPLPAVRVHSQNPIGADWIKEVLEVKI